MVVWFRKLEEQRGLKNHNKIKIEWFGTKTTFLSRTDPRKMMGSWQARHFVRNFDADLLGWVSGGHFLRQKIIFQQKALELRSRSDEMAIKKHKKCHDLMF